MKRFDDLKLPRNLQEAVRAARDRLGAEFSIDRIVLFGSVVRGTAGEESDTDLFVVLREPPDHQVRNRISRGEKVTSTFLKPLGHETLGRFHG